MAKTIQQRAAEYLLSIGETEILPSASRKARQFTRKAGGFFWLGKAGSIRAGQTYTRSFSVADFTMKLGYSGKEMGA